jgi:hypothetical protein
MHQHRLCICNHYASAIVMQVQLLCICTFCAFAILVQVHSVCRCNRRAGGRAAPGFNNLQATSLQATSLQISSKQPPFRDIATARPGFNNLQATSLDADADAHSCDRVIEIASPNLPPSDLPRPIQIDGATPSQRYIALVLPCLKNQGSIMYLLNHKRGKIPCTGFSQHQYSILYYLPSKGG